MKDCYKETLFGIEVDPPTIDACILKSFNGGTPEKCTSNSFLDSESKLKRKEEIYLYPNLEIGSLSYRVS